MARADLKHDILKDELKAMFHNWTIQQGQGMAKGPQADQRQGLQPYVSLG